MRSKSYAYFLHRIGVTFASAGVFLWASFFIENQNILGMPIGRASFFWSLGMILMSGPMMLVLSRSDSLRFVVFELSLFAAYGALAFALPSEILPRIISVLTIAVFMILIVLKRSHGGSLILDMKTRVTDLMAVESLVLFAVSWSSAILLQSVRMTSGSGTFSAVASYLLSWTALFILFSLIVIVVRIALNRSHRGAGTSPTRIVYLA